MAKNGILCKFVMPFLIGLLGNTASMYNVGHRITVFRVDESISRPVVA